MVSSNRPRSGMRRAATACASGGRCQGDVPSAKKIGAMGTRLDVPIGHINAAYVRSHFDAIEIGLPDAPYPDEILFCLVMACGPRIHARVAAWRRKT